MFDAKTMDGSPFQMSRAMGSHPIQLDPWLPPLVVQSFPELKEGQVWRIQFPAYSCLSDAFMKVVEVREKSSVLIYCGEAPFDFDSFVIEET